MGNCSFCQHLMAVFTAQNIEPWIVKRHKNILLEKVFGRASCTSSICIHTHTHGRTSPTTWYRLRAFRAFFPFFSWTSPVCVWLLFWEHPRKEEKRKEEEKVSAYYIYFFFLLLLVCFILDAAIFYAVSHSCSTSFYLFILLGSLFSVCVLFAVCHTSAYSLALTLPLSHYCYNFLSLTPSTPFLFSPGSPFIRSEARPLFL